MIREGTPVFAAQNRMLDQLVPQQCLDLIEAIFGQGSFVTTENVFDLRPIEGSEPAAGAIALKYSDFCIIVRLCFRLLKMSAFGNTRNKALLAPHIPRMLHYLEWPTLGALEALAEIFKDNFRVVDTPDDLSYVTRFTELALANKQKQSGYLHFLRLLCCCEGVGLKHAQLYVASELFDDAHSQSSKDEPPIFMRLVSSTDGRGVCAQYFFQIKEPNLGASMRSRPGSRAFAASVQGIFFSGDAGEFVNIPFEEFCKNDVELGVGDPRRSSRQSIASGSGKSMSGTNTVLGYFCAQLELFTALCMGRLQANIDRCLAVFPEELVLALIQTPRIPAHVRSLLMDYWRATCLDIEPNEDRVDAARNLVYVWENDVIGVESGPRKVPSNLERIQQMKNYLLIFLKANHVLDPTDQLFNSSVLSAVRCVRSLVAFGLLIDPETDRKGDKLIEWVKALSAVLDGRDDKEPIVDERYIRRFGKFSRYRLDEGSQMMMEVKIAVMEVFEMFLDYARAAKVRNLITVFRQHNEIPHMCAFLDLRPESKVDKESKDLKEKREEIEAQKGANMLMASLGAIKSAAGATMGAISAVGGAIASVIPGMSDEAEDSLLYLNNLIDVLLDNMQYEYEPVVSHSTKLLLSLMNVQQGLMGPLSGVQILSSAVGVEYYLQVKPKLVELQGYASTQLSRMDYPEVQKLIESLAESLRLDPIELTINAERQGILRNLGAHTLVCTFLSIAQDVNTGNPSSYVLELLSEIYSFLRLMISGSTEIALELFPFADRMVRHLILRVGSCVVLCAMFDGNLDLASSVTDTILLDIVYSLPRLDNDPEIAYLLLLLVWQPALGPITRNQQTILKYLLECDEATPGVVRCREFFTGPNGRKRRAGLLDHHDFLGTRSAIAYHLLIMTVIAHCAKGKDDTRRHDIRQGLFGGLGIDDVLEVLTNKQLPHFYRVVYLHFFREVYLEDKSIRMNIAEHKFFSRLLELFQDDFSKVDQLLRGEGPDQPNDEGKFGESLEEKKSVKLPQPEDNEGDEHSHLQKSMQSREVFLHYVFEGVVPTLSTLLYTLLPELFHDDDPNAFASPTGFGDDVEMDQTDRLMEKVKDLAEVCCTLLTIIVENHPIQPKGTEPGSETPRATRSVPLHLRSGLRKWILDALRSNLTLSPTSFEAETAEFPDVEKVVPIQHIISLKEVVLAFVHHNLRAGDPELMALLAAVDRYPSVAPPVKVAEPTLEVTRFNQWRGFLDKFKKSSEQLSDDCRYSEAARILMRKGIPGHNAIKSAVRICDSHTLDDLDRIAVLELLRQILLCPEEEHCDASLIQLKAVEIDEADEGKKYEIIQQTLTLDKTLEQRQNIFASWSGEESLAKKCFHQISNAKSHYLLAILRLACELLRDGNRKAQQAVYDYMTQRSDEDFFVEVRHRLLNC
jgi:hypothetical protein